ncbi:MAG: MarR family transcriptional regulator [Oscillospiraceae bacterium]|jgi:MarR family multiple gene transcriptional regulator MgrA|nr:MarR family transcriptional regulator [Oscillospiraceae bacterium]
MAERSNLAHNIFRLHNAVVKERNRVLSDNDLTSTQADVIVFISEYDGAEEINQLDIQQAFHLTNPTISGLIDRLEEKGFVKRVRSAYDARYRKIELCEKSTAILEKLISNAEQIEDELLSGLSETEKSEFIIYFKKVLETAEEKN